MRAIGEFLTLAAESEMAHKLRIFLVTYISDTRCDLDIHLIAKGVQIWRFQLACNALFSAYFPTQQPRFLLHGIVWHLRAL